MEIEEKLIFFVQRYECLYNVSSKHYSDRNAKNNAWDKISEQLGLSAPDCQKRWKKIRDSYRRSINLRKDGKSGSARVKAKPIKFEKELEFLKKYVVQENSQVSNLDDSSTYSINDDSQSIQSPLQANSPVSRPGSVSRSPSHTRNISQQPRASEILSRYIEAKKEEDSTDYFFKSMASKVKGMPNKIKAEIERKIFQIVNDAELKLTEQEEVNLLYSQYHNYETEKNDTYTPSNMNNFQASRRSAPYTYTPSSVNNNSTEITGAPLPNYETEKNNTYTPSNLSNFQASERSAPTYTPSSVSNNNTEITATPLPNYETEKNDTYTPSNLSNFQASERSAPTYTPSSVSNNNTEITATPLPNYETEKNDTYTPSNLSNFQASERSAPTYTPSSVSNNNTEITATPLPNYETEKNDTYTPSNMSNFQAARRSAPYTYTPSSVSNDETEITDAPFTDYEITKN